MARTSGVTCDVCGTFTTTLNDNLPDEWIKVTLPHSNGAAPADYLRDLCSNKCMMVLGRERAKAGGELKSVSGKAKSTMDPKLREFLLANGVKPSGMGGKMMSHVRDKHESTRARPGCLVCQFYADGEIAGLDRDSD